MNKINDNQVITSIEIMKQEHEEIRRMLKIIRKACNRILQGEPINFEHFKMIIDFIMNYADSHHHGKEEKFLFAEMENRLGPLGTKLIRNGMYVEHDLGRLYVKELGEALERVKEGDEESKLDVIANAVSYTHLLERHIAKENEVVYGFGISKLPVDVLEAINQQTALFEEEAADKGIQIKYLEILKILEAIY